MIFKSNIIIPFCYYTTTVQLLHLDFKPNGDLKSELPIPGPLRGHVYALGVD